PVRRPRGSWRWNHTTSPSSAAVVWSLRGICRECARGSGATPWRHWRKSRRTTVVGKRSDWRQWDRGLWRNGVLVGVTPGPNDNKGGRRIRPVADVIRDERRKALAQDGRAKKRAPNATNGSRSLGPDVAAALDQKNTAEARARRLLRAERPG